MVHSMDDSEDDDHDTDYGSEDDDHDTDYGLNGMANAMANSMDDSEDDDHHPSGTTRIAYPFGVSIHDHGTGYSYYQRRQRTEAMINRIEQADQWPLRPILPYTDLKTNASVADVIASTATAAQPSPSTPIAPLTLKQRLAAAKERARSKQKPTKNLSNS